MRLLNTSLIGGMISWLIAPALADTIPAAKQAKVSQKFEIGAIQKSGPAFQILEEPAAQCHRDVVFSADSRYLATSFFPRGGGLDTVAVWNRDTKKKQHLLKQPSAAYALRFVNNKDWLLSGHEDGKIRVWDYKEGKLLETLESKDPKFYAVWALEVSPDGSGFASGGRNLALWETATRKARVVDLGLRFGILPKLAYSPSGRFVVGSFEYGQIGIWDVATGKQSRQIRAQAAHLAVAPDGQTLATADHGAGPAGCQVRLWNLDDGREIASMPAFRGAAARVAFSADGRYLLAAGTDSFGVSGKGGAENNVEWPFYLRVWELASGKQVNAFSLWPSQTGRFSLSPDGKWLAAWAAIDQELRLYDMKTVVAAGATAAP